MLSDYFELGKHRTSIRTEVIAGITTFMTMAYILAVNPNILSEAGLDRGAVFTATALAAGLATLVMALYARLPFALAPGMGLNAFFAYTVCLEMGYPWQLALTAVFVEGLIFLALTFLNVREAIINSIPANLKRAIAVGIGLFIAVIGLSNAGIVIQGSGTLAGLGDLTAAEPLLALTGLVLTGTLLAFRIKGSLLIGIALTALIGWPIGVTQAPTGWGAPPSLGPIFCQFDWSQFFSLDMVIVLLTFLFVDMFDTAGTLIGVATKSGMLDAQGRVPRARRALLADALGTTVGACLGTSTVTVYVESAAGTAAGGRTGLTALTTGILFFVSLLLWPLFLVIPAAATAPALILVGLFMLSPIKEIDLEDYTEAIPAYMTIIGMPLAGIASGIMLGMLSYIMLKVLTGRWREVSPVAYGVGGFFLLKLVV